VLCGHPPDARLKETEWGTSRGRLQIQGGSSQGVVTCNECTVPLEHSNSCWRLGKTARDRICPAIMLHRLEVVAPRAGFEPATDRLTADCSTTELPGNIYLLISEVAYSKRVSLLQRTISIFFD
jgi:hypothetical protein